MARADRRRAQRSKHAPGIRASGQATAVEQTLFFSRLRKNAKWVFVFLALAFALGFVVFGVGAGGTGIGDILQGRSSGSGAPSVEKAQERVDENPRDPVALRDLATALQNEGQPDEAIPILERYSRVRPRDESALQELASVYTARAGRLRNEAQLAQAQAQTADPGSALLPPSTTPLGQALANRPISNAIASDAQTELTAKIDEMQAAFRSAQQTYERIATLRPDHAPTQLDLGFAALNAGDNTVAIAAFKRFLELAPDDPQAPAIKAQIKQLESSTSSSSG